MSVTDTVEDDYPIVKNMLIEATWLLVASVENPNNPSQEFLERYEAFRLEVDKYNGIMDE